jgi:hypothetical protein
MQGGSRRAATHRQLRRRVLARITPSELRSLIERRDPSYEILCNQSQTWMRGLNQTPRAGSHTGLPRVQ